MTVIMSKGATFIFLLAISLLSIVCVGVGLFSPAWLVYDMTYQHDTQIEIGLGLFSGHACVKLQGYQEQCGSFSEDAILSSISDQPESNQVAVRGLFVNIRTTQILAILGMCASLVAVGFKIAFRRSDNRCFGVCAASLWLSSGILLIAAVATQANMNHNVSVGVDVIKAMPELKDTLDIEIHFPWALLVTGIGAALKFVCALILSLYLCFGKTEEGVGTWNRFTNQAI